MQIGVMLNRKTYSIPIVAQGITKKYGKKIILQDTSIEVHSGEVIALVGENGSGKSTLLKVLAGLIPVNSGIIETDSNKKLAYIPDRFDKCGLTIREFMKHTLRIEDILQDDKVTVKLYRDFFLEDMIDTPMKYLSKGTLQKAAVLQALIDKRDLLFLDEPLSGQDYLSQSNFVMHMKKRKAEGMSIVMACHEPYLIHELADRILQIKSGILVDGTNYIYGFGDKKVIIIISSEKTIEEIDKIFKIELVDLKAKPILSRQGNMVKIEVDKENGKDILKWIVINEICLVKYEEVSISC